MAGMVRGDITARKVAILSTGRVHGDLLVESLITEEGGFMQGQIRMEETVDLSEWFPEPASEPSVDPQGSKTLRAVKPPSSGKSASQ